jgi:hypothetical protein
MVAESDADLLINDTCYRNTEKTRFSTAFRVPDVCSFRTFVGSSVGQWQDGHGEIHHRFWSESHARSLHTNRRATSQKSQSDALAGLMPDQ